MLCDDTLQINLVTSLNPVTVINFNIATTAMQTADIYGTFPEDQIK